MAIPKCILKETYLKKVEMRMNHHQSREIKPGSNIRVNLNISKGFNRLSPAVQEVELTLDLHAIHGERQFYQALVVQAGIFEVQADPEMEKNPSFVEMIETECSRHLFPFLKEAVVNLSQKSGFNHRFFDHVDFDRLLDPAETETAKTMH